MTQRPHQRAKSPPFVSHIRDGDLPVFDGGKKLQERTAFVRSTGCPRGYIQANAKRLERHASVCAIAFGCTLGKCHLSV